ncbi:MAG TPA: ABC transporter ATP-binding protein [Terriglobales bacterium]|nr:ABC transporter ATP-binding protein [Terriglobales bacterium]
MIELVEVRKIYHQGLPDETVAVGGVTLTIAANSVTVLRGPSGSGKTSLLSLIGGMARPTSGRVWVAGREITSLPERFLTAVRRNTFGFVFQHSNLVRGITTLENVMLPAYPLGGSRASLEARAEGLLEQLGLSHRARARAEWLSGGEAQRAAVARALINEPQVIVADEPTAHLDSKASRELMGILAGLRTRGKTIVIASHDPVVYEGAAVDRVIGIRDGRLDGDGR